MKRRSFLRGLSASAALAFTGSPLVRALAGASQADRRFVFVFAEGGWDPLCVFAPNFGAPATIDMEPRAERWSPAGFALVDHPNRPNVRRYFDEWGARTAVLNGISVRSVAHEVCTQLVLTGSSSVSSSDWPSLIASSRPAATPLPELVLSGPSFPGDASGIVSRVGDNYQLQRLIDDVLFEEVELEPELLAADQRAAVDQFVRARAERAAQRARGGRAERLTASLRDAFPRADWLHSLGSDTRFDAGESGDDDDDEAGVRLARQIDPALAALTSGASRVVTLATGGDWDTHGDNAPQTPLFDRLFSQLSTLVGRLASATGPDGAALLDTTTVVVLSEMARTPKYNETAGRDHWPFTSAMLIGSGIRGGRSYGAYDDRFTGLGVDPASGETSASAPAVTTAELGATLLHLGGAEPPDVVRSAQPLVGMLQ